MIKTEGETPQLVHTGTRHGDVAQFSVRFYRLVQQAERERARQASWERGLGAHQTPEYLFTASGMYGSRETTMAREKGGVDRVVGCNAKVWGQEKFMMVAIRLGMPYNSKRSSC